MPTSWGSDSVNGQLVPRAVSSAFFPLVFSGQYTGPGFYPKQGTYQVPPVLPSAYSQNANLAAGQFGSAVPNAGNGLTPSSGGSPFHPTQSAVIFAFIALAGGLFMLKYIHWG